MNVVPRVLLVDGPTETRDVLEAVFQPRGVNVQRIRSHTTEGERSEGTPAAGAGTIAERTDGSPRVIVLHEQPTAAEQTWADVPRIVIGRAEFDQTDAHALSKPYDYGELVRAIEALLEEFPAA